MRVNLPCVHEGEELPWECDSTHFQHRRRWLRCKHPELPLGEFVCGAKGCGPGCTGYAPDPDAEPTVGLVPLWTKRMLLPVPGAFNASVLPWLGGYLLAYRSQPPGSRVFVARLGLDFAFLGEVKVEIEHPRASLAQEDPRLFLHGGAVHVAFCGVEPWAEHPHKIKASVLYARLGGDLQPEGVWCPDYDKRSAWEKNWAFFSENGKLYAVYNVKPHVVLEIDGDKVVREYRTDVPHAWSGGHLRGGASPVLHGGEFYHFFHGRVGAYDATTYTTGVYTFEPTPPFRVVRMTREPIQWGDHDRKVGEQVRGAAVVFVGGACWRRPAADEVALDRQALTGGWDAPDGGHWLVAQGVGDREVELVAWRGQDIEGALKETRKPCAPADAALPPVYAIYCDEIPDRKETLGHHLAGHKIAPRWWRSFHGKTWGLATQKVYVEGESPINAGQVGLVLGHYTLWQHMEALGLEEIIVLEDDAVLCDDFAGRFAASRASFPADAGLVYIGHLGCEDRIREYVAGDVCALSFVPWGTHGYWLHKRALPELLSRMKEVRNPVDSQLWYNVLKDNHVGWYAVHPSLIDQRSAHGLTGTTLDGFGDWSIHPEPLRTQLTEAQAMQHGWCTLEKARMLAGLVMRERPRVVVEIGVYGGKSLVPLALALKQLDEGGVVYGIDPWTTRAATEGFHQDDPNFQWWSQVPLAEVYRGLCRHLTDNWLWDWVRLLCAPAQDVAHAFDDRPIDILHIDGTHSEVASCRDVRLYVPRVRPGGWVWFDDSQWETTQRAQREVECSCRLVIDAPAVGGGLRLYRKV